MTLKHIKFEDSSTMRSLERVAREKGWVKDEPITKVASKVNLVATSNLTENILKLCAGLRQSGFENYASDIENKYVAFKQASTLYDTSNETGEDLVEFAHPKGSHKMEGLDNAVFKTIVEKHLDMLNMVGKKPTGKLSNASDILNAVKVILAQEAPAEKGSVAVDALGGVAGMAGASVLGWFMKVLYSKLSAAGQLQKLAPGMLDELKSAGTNPSKAQINNLLNELKKHLGKDILNKYKKSAAEEVAKKVSEKAASEAGKKVVQKGLQEGAKTVVKEVAKDVAQEGVKDAVQVAAKSPGVWSRLLGLGSTEIGGGSVVGVGASVVGAAALGAAIGYVVGNWAFDKYRAPEAINDAGKKLLEQVDNAKNDLSNVAKLAAMDFSKHFDAVLSNYSVLEEIEKNKSPKDLPKLKTLFDALNNSNSDAQKIWTAAQDDSDKRSWMDKALSPVSSYWGEKKNVVAVAKNYMERSMKVINFINELIVSINRELDKTIKEKHGLEENVSVARLESIFGGINLGFTNAIQKINSYKGLIAAKTDLKPNNKTTATKYLDSLLAIVKEKQGELNVDEKNKYSIEALNKFKSVLDEVAGETKGRLQEFKGVWKI